MKKVIIYLIVSVLVVSGVLCAKSVYSSKDLFEANVEVLADEEGGSGGFDRMCVKTYVSGTIRYDCCDDCSKWVNCMPTEIKYCQ